MNVGTVKSSLAAAAQYSDSGARGSCARWDNLELGVIDKKQALLRNAREFYADDLSLTRWVPQSTVAHKDRFEWLLAVQRLRR